MLGAIVGDVVGSRFERNNCRSKTLDIFTEACFPTDDSMMTIAIGKALLETAPSFQNIQKAATYWMQRIGRKYPDCGYGSSFYTWLFEDAIRNAVSIGGDSDTIAAICGSVAEFYYGVPSTMREKVYGFLDKELVSLVSEFETVTNFFT